VGGVHFHALGPTGSTGATQSLATGAGQGIGKKVTAVKCEKALQQISLAFPKKIVWNASTTKNRAWKGRKKGGVFTPRKKKVPSKKRCSQLLRKNGKSLKVTSSNTKKGTHNEKRHDHTLRRGRLRELGLSLRTR